MNDYPTYWQQGIAQAIMATLMNWRCEVCDAAIDPATNRTIDQPPMRNGLQPVIAIHHIDGDKSNCHWRNLLYSCQVCHLRVQGLWQPGDVLPLCWPEPPAWMVKRGLAYVENPQMRLFEALT